MFDREFIMPLTSGKTLYHVGQKRLPIISPEDTMKVDMLIFLQAKRYVAGPKSDWLNVVSQVAKTYKTQNQQLALKKQVFDLFQ